ncbi:MAG: energy transducer TonB [Prevotellaceae bacterium]|jgi:protein TonB|nr:energy transducer TonB [Prevotellaceae bacterium]
MEAKKSKKASLEGLRGIFFECGLIVGLFFMIVAFNWSSGGEVKSLLSSSMGEIVDDFYEINTFPDDPPPPPGEVLMPEISDEILLVDNNENITSMDFFNPENMKAPVVITEYVRPTETKPEVAFEEPDVDYNIVPEKPKFMGGDANGFSKWVSSKIVYPTIELENNVQGRVILQFRIGPDGVLSNIKVLRSISPGLDKEAIRVVSSSPPWTPGMQNGKAVGVIYTFPVNFVLNN